MVLKFDFAIIAIFFDTENYDESLTDEEVAWFLEWWSDF